MRRATFVPPPIGQLLTPPLRGGAVSRVVLARQFLKPCVSRNLCKASLVLAFSRSFVVLMRSVRVGNLAPLGAIFGEFLAILLALRGVLSPAPILPLRILGALVEECQCANESDENRSSTVLEEQLPPLRVVHWPTPN